MYCNYDFYFNISENALQHVAIHDFSVLLRTVSNPTDINRFRSHTGKGFKGLVSYIRYDPICFNYLSEVNSNIFNNPVL